MSPKSVRLKRKAPLCQALFPASQRSLSPASRELVLTPFPSTSLTRPDSSLVEDQLRHNCSAAKIQLTGFQPVDLEPFYQLF